VTAQHSTVEPQRNGRASRVVGGQAARFARLAIIAVCIDSTFTCHAQSNAAPERPIAAKNED